MKKLLIIGLALSLLLYADDDRKKMDKKAENYSKIVLAGGCFWCLEPPYDKIDGVVKTVVGYAGGEEKNPSYEQVAAGLTGHTEVIEITYDPKKVGLEKLLDVFWRNIDPLDRSGQFCDKGRQYRTAVFYSDEQERKLALKTRSKAEKQIALKGEFVTEITPLDRFYPAEDYHQEYYIKNPYRYKFYPLLLWKG